MANNIDRLFRENLDQVEITPSAEGWNQVKSQLTKKRPAWVIPMRIAAAVTLLIVASLIIFNEQDAHQALISGADHPVLDVQPDLKLPAELIAKAETPATESKNKMVTIPAKTEQPVKEEAVTLPEPIHTMTVAGLSTPMLETGINQKPVLVEKPDLDQPSIRITYIASNVPEEKEGDSEKGIKLNKVLSLAKEVTNAELLADIRDAKDNLFNRN